MYTYVYYTYVCVYKQGKKISFFTVNWRQGIFFSLSMYLNDPKDLSTVI